MEDWLSTDPPDVPEDWLDLPDEPVSDMLPVLFGETAETPAEDAKSRNAAVKAAWDKLSANQRVFLQMWPACRYNTSDAVRRLAGTANAVSRHTVVSWQRFNEAFKFMQKMMRSAAIESVIDRDKLLLRSDEIAQKALEPKPILYQGAPTGFFEHDLRTALSANEQLMKTQKMLGGEDEAKVFGNRSIVFNVQVVQSDGTLADAKPTGVVIDMPVPDGSN